MLKIGIFIPTYNATKTLPIVLDRIPKELRENLREIFVIDNASPDNTYLTALGYREVSGLPNFRVYKNEKNIGYGGSQKRAYQYCIDQGFDVVIMLHGDAQYAPEKIPYLLEPFEQGENVDMVFGSRMTGLPLKGGMPLHRFLGNKVLTAIENFVLEWNLSEFHSGFRVFSCKALAQVPFYLCSDDYHFDTEILIQFKLRGLKVVERPIPTYYGDERSYVNVWKYGCFILRSLAEYILHKKGIRRYEKFDIVPLPARQENSQTLRPTGQRT